MSIEAGKDKIILVDVSVLEHKEEGFNVKNGENHNVGTVYSVPSKEDFYKEGDKVVLRDRIVPEKLNFENTEYTFVQSLDILCKIK